MCYSKHGVIQGPRLWVGNIAMSKHVLSGIVFILAVLAGPPLNQAKSESFLGGFILQDLCWSGPSVETCDGYINGVVDALDPVGRPFIQTLGNVCVPLTVRRAELHQKAVDYMQRNPATLGFSGAMVVARAISDAYPCGSGTPR